MNEDRENSINPEENNKISAEESTISPEKNKLRFRDFLPLILAIPLALLVKVMIFNTFHVPTSSMEGTITPGDRIIVEKWVYGPRFFFGKSIWRFPGWRPVERGDILVFNVPKEDSIFSRDPAVSFYDQKIKAKESAGAKWDSVEYVPIPGRTPFVKRVVGLPGDVLTSGHLGIRINGLNPYSDSTIVMRCTIVFPDTNSFDRYRKELYKKGQQVNMNRSGREVRGFWEKGVLNQMRENWPANIKIDYSMNVPYLSGISPVFWELKALYQNKEVIIPSRGWKHNVDKDFLSVYGSLISRFDCSTARIRNDKLYIDGDSVAEYTFKKDYYWVLGDNRPHSIDSRYWGFVPDDHIIGITRRILWSKEPYLSFRDGVRWNRFWERIH